MTNIKKIISIITVVALICSICPSLCSCVFIKDYLKIAPDLPSELDSIEAFHNEIQKNSEHLGTELKLYITSSLYTTLTKDERIQLWDILADCGIYYADIKYDTTLDQESSTGFLYLDNISFLSGYKCLHAVRTGDFTVLNEKDLAVYEQASAILASLIDADSALVTEKNIHDWMCDNITSGSDAGEEADSAYDALVLRSCVCGGYADAFYLLCNMAGIEAFYRYGDDKNPETEERHMWNLVNINEANYNVDVAWDDRYDSSDVNTNSYIYFNMGDSELSYDHIFSSEIHNVASNTVPEYTYYGNEQLSGNTIFYDIDSAARALVDNAVAGNLVMHLKIEGIYDLDTEAVNNAIKSAVDNSYNASWQVSNNQQGNDSYIDCIFDYCYQ